MHFDYTVTLGNILTVIGVLPFLWRAVRSLARIELKVETLWDDYQDRREQDDNFRRTLTREIQQRHR